MTVYGYCKSDPDIPIGELDYGFIGKCEDANKLQKILGILRSGEEGRYPDLEQFTEKQLAKQKPDSPMLEKLNRERKTQDMPMDEMKKTIDELITMSSIPVGTSNRNGSVVADLPPIRSSKGTEHTRKTDPEVAVETRGKPKNAVPQSPDYWEKLNKQVDMEDSGDYANICKEKSRVTLVNNDSQSKPAHELLAKEKPGILQTDAALSVQNEKNKGNEAFRCGDYKEALIYYNRSIDLLPTSTCYNNKAITLIKLEHFKEALDACEIVLKLEPNNLKAHLRRGIAYQSLENLDEAVKDFRKVMELAPTNKRGEELLELALKELEKKSENQKKKGHRLKIEEVNTSGIGQINNGLHACNKEHSSEINMKDHINLKINEGSHCQVEIEDQKVAVDNNEENAASTMEGANENDTSGMECENQVKEKVKSVETKLMSAHNAEIVTTESAKLETATGSCNESVCAVDQQCIKKVVMELPGNVLTRKDRGNELFKTGQYDQACQMYTTCINELLETKSGYEESLAVLFSNRASCQMRMGNSKQCISDCHQSLGLLPSAKVYLKRAKAYESSEKYLNAYVDYQNVVKMDSSVVTAFQSCSRLGNALKSQYGNTWREMLPKSNHIPLNTSYLKSFYTKETVAFDDSSLKVCIDDNDECKAGTSGAESMKNNLQVHRHVGANSASSEKSTCMSGEVEEVTIPSKAECVANARNTLSPCGDSLPSVPTLQEVDHVSKPLIPVMKDEKSPNNKKGKYGLGDIKITQEKLAKEQKVLGFFETKEKGNICVQHGKYEEAIQCYTQCVEFLPNEIPSYTNRALCYLKLKQPEKAIQDCSHALKLQKSHVKALFRRAQARRMLKEYKEALADLTQVLKLEPNNNAAKKEMEQCKSEFHSALRSIQAENEAAKLRELKGKSKKVTIEEITSESAESTAKGKLSTKSGKCPLSKESNLKNTQSSKMTGFEFLHAWNNAKSKKTIDYAELLMQIDPTKLVDLLSNKLDGEILKNFIHTINEHFTSKDMFRRGIQLLKSLCKASRFVTMLMFLNTTEKALLRSTLDSLENRAKQTNEKTLISDVSSLRVSYQCS